MDILRCFPILSASLLFSVSAYSDGSLHEPPFDYWFGNHMDTHQQTRLNEEGSLFGFLYVIDTGEVDADSGLPIMHHPRGLGETYDERCGISVKCIKGWQLRGQPGHAKFLFHSGVNGNDHPVWLVNRVDILQPGHYSHFHWIRVRRRISGPVSYPKPVTKRWRGSWKLRNPMPLMKPARAGFCNSPP